MNEKLFKIINERQLVSAMNKTKWRELCRAFETLHDVYISVRYKLINADELFGFSPVCWPELLAETPAIEWLEFDPIVREARGQLVPDKIRDVSEMILEILNKHGINYAIEGQYFKVWGYLS